MDLLRWLHDTELCFIYKSGFLSTVFASNARCSLIHPTELVAAIVAWDGCSEVGSESVTRLTVLVSQYIEHRVDSVI
jgi:hypothetical protein